MGTAPGRHSVPRPFIIFKESSARGLQCKATPICVARAAGVICAHLRRRRFSVVPSFRRSAVPTLRGRRAVAQCYRELVDSAAISYECKRAAWS